VKVVFLLAIYDSFGEREHALSFASQLAAAGIEPSFVVTAPSLPHLRARGVTAREFATADEAMAIVGELAPDWLVACEWFNLPPELRDAVANARCRLATMDGTGMGPEINANPFLVASPPPPIDVPDSMIRLRPCPVNAPLPPDGRIFSWPLFPSLARSDGTAARRRWGIAGDTRVAMLAIAPWALAAAVRLGRGAHYRELLDSLVDALAAAQLPVELVAISPDAAPPLARDRVKVRFEKYLAPDVYEELLLGCDLVVSDNVIQTSLSKAFAARIPALVVVDSRGDAPWNMFPLALRFAAGAPYYRAVAPVELGDAAALRARVAAALAGDVGDDRGYRAALATLPSPAAILRSA
jgi:hypothetical protein